MMSRCCHSSDDEVAETTTMDVVVCSNAEFFLVNLNNKDKLQFLTCAFSLFFFFFCL